MKGFHFQIAQKQMTLKDHLVSDVLGTSRVSRYPAFSWPSFFQENILDYLKKRGGLQSLQASSAF